MENRRKKVRLGDVCSKISKGTTPKGGKKFYKESGIPFVRSQNICHNMFDYNGLVFIEADTAEKMKSIELEQGDLLLNINVNPTLRYTLVPEDIVGGRVNQHVCIMRPKHNIIDPVFLKYYLMWEKTQNLLISMVGEGITRITLSKKMIEDLEINIPPLEEQKKIASIISSLDYKIQLNDEVNKTLEQIAHAIFESWFVDFEPFKDKGFEKSQLGIIPKGWKVEKMACVVPVTDGTHDSPKKRESGYRLLTSKHIKNNKVQFKEANFISEEDFIKINKRSKVEKFDVLITMIGTIGNTLLVQDECINYAIKNIGLIKTSLNRSMAEFIFMYLSSDRIKNYIKTKVTGNGQPYISLGNLKDVPVIVPPADVIGNFQKIVSKLYKKIEKNNTMNENLTTIRDKILSKLMLGEVIVKKYGRVG